MRTRAIRPFVEMKAAHRSDRAVQSALPSTCLAFRTPMENGHTQRRHLARAGSPSGAHGRDPKHSADRVEEEQTKPQTQKKHSKNKNKTQTIVRCQLLVSFPFSCIIPLLGFCCPCRTLSHCPLLVLVCVPSTWLPALSLLLVVVVVPLFCPFGCPFHCIPATF